MKQAGVVYYPLTDHLGSTTITTDAAGTAVSELRYTPWGKTRLESGSSLMEYKFTGQFSNESDFGLYYFNARWYDPYLMQFSSPDSLVPDPYNSLDYNRYGYARYNPLKYTDSTGHFVVLVVAGVVIDAVAVALIGAATLSVAHNVLPGREERTAALATAIDQTLSFAKRKLTLAEKTQNSTSQGSGIDPKDPISGCQTNAQKFICGLGAVTVAGTLIKAAITGGNGEDESNSNFPPTSNPGPTTTPTLPPTSTPILTPTMTPTLTNTPTSIPTIFPGFTHTPFSPTWVPRHYYPYRYDGFNQ